MTKNHLRIHNHQGTRTKSRGESCRKNSWKDTLPEESIDTQKATNAPHLISQSKPPEPK